MLFLYRTTKLSTKITIYYTAWRFWPKWLGRPALMVNLASLLYTRFEQLGSLSVLDEAVAFERTILELCPQSHSDRAYSLGNLAVP